MSFSYVGLSSGATSGTPYSPTFPASLQEGDLLLLFTFIAPDAGSQGITASAPGWVQQSGFGQPARLMWARYSANLALPVLTLTGGPTATWRMVAFRSTLPNAFGRQYAADGFPPAATDVTTTNESSLLVICGSGVGDGGVGWTQSGGYTVVVNIDGNGSGDPNAVNMFIGYKAITGPSLVSAQRVYVVSNRYYILTLGENPVGPFFNL